MIWSTVAYRSSEKCLSLRAVAVNPLMGTLKPQSNGPLYTKTVIGTLTAYW